MLPSIYTAAIIWHAEGPESQVTLLWNWRSTVAGKCRRHGNYCCSLCQVYSILVWIADETCSEGHYAKWQGLYGSHPLTMNTDYSQRHLSRNANTMFLIYPIISHAISLSDGICSCGYWESSWSGKLCYTHYTRHYEVAGDAVVLYVSLRWAWYSTSCHKHHSDGQTLLLHPRVGSVRRVEREAPDQMDLLLHREQRETHKEHAL